MSDYVKASRAVESDPVKLYTYMLAGGRLSYGHSIDCFNADLYTLMQYGITADQHTELIKRVIGVQSIFKQLAKTWTPSIEQLTEVISIRNYDDDIVPHLTALQQIPTPLINAFLKSTQYQKVIKLIRKSVVDDSTMVVVCGRLDTSKQYFNLIIAELYARGASYSSESLMAASERHNIHLINDHINHGIIPTEAHLKAWLQTDDGITGTDIFLKYFTPSADLMELAILHDNTTLIKALRKHAYTPGALIAAIKNGNRSLIEKIIVDIHPNQDHLLLACQLHKFELVKLFESYRLSIGDREFNAFFRIPKVRHVDTNVMPDQIEWFVSHGYELKIDDVAMLARRGVIIRDIERFGFVFNDDFLFESAENGWWGYDLPMKQELFLTICKFADYWEIARWIESGCKVDNECLFEVLLRGEIRMAELLLQFVEPDARCLRRMKCKEKFFVNWQEKINAVW